MKKIIILLSLFIIAISASSTAQEAKKDTIGKKEGFFHRMFKSNDITKPRAQMQHFDTKKKDKKLKHNGTLAWNERKRKKNKKQDTAGFSAPAGGNGNH